MLWTLAVVSEEQLALSTSILQSVYIFDMFKFEMHLQLAANPKVPSMLFASAMTYKI